MLDERAEANLLLEEAQRRRQRPDHARRAPAHEHGSVAHLELIELDQAVAVLVLVAQERSHESRADREALDRAAGRPVSGSYPAQILDLVVLPRVAERHEIGR